MAAGESTRFAIRYDSWYDGLSRLLRISPDASFVELRGADVTARMGWAFSARFPRSAVVSTGLVPGPVLSRGVHGWGGRWLVNGSGLGLVAIQLAPNQRARVLGFSVSLQELIVSVADPTTLMAALSGRRA